MITIQQNNDATPSSEDLLELLRRILDRCSGLRVLVIEDTDITAGTVDRQLKSMKEMKQMHEMLTNRGLPNLQYDAEQEKVLATAVGETVEDRVSSHTSVRVISFY